MKKLLFLLFLASAFYLISCISSSNQVLRSDQQLIDFAKDIIKNPEKLFDLKKNFPEFYDYDYLDNKNMRDSIYIRNLIDNNINSIYKKINERDRIFYEPESKWYLENYSQINKIKNINDSNIIELVLSREFFGIYFLFISIGDKYYICKIGSIFYNP